MTLSIILNSIFLFLTLLSCLISISVLIIIFIYIRPSLSNISLLLTCNTYFTLIIFSFTLLDIGIHSLYGHLNPSKNFSGHWCFIRSYFAHVCFCVFYNSFVLQAIFRLFRVVFHQKRILQSSGSFSLVIFLQWAISFILISSHLFSHDFQYQPSDYNCWISFKNLRGMFLAILTIYTSPILLTIIIYTYILHYIRGKVNIQKKQRRANKRDLIILKRIVILLLFLIMIGIPTLSVLLIYIITNYLTSFAYDIQAINISLGLVITSITLIFITPKIRMIFRCKKKQFHRKTIPQLLTSSSGSRQMTESV